MRWTRRQVLTAIEASGDSQAAAAEAVAALESRLRGFDPVVPWHNGALGFLPFVDLAGATAVAARIQEEFPEFSVHADTIPAWELLSPSAASGRFLSRASLRWQSAVLPAAAVRIVLSANSGC